MTPLYLVCYIIYHIIISTVFSLILAFRHLLSRVSAGRFRRSCKEYPGNVVALYEGTVCHVRRHPVHNSFKFPARYALINLDLPPYSPPNYLSADHVRRAANTNGPVFLLRIPPSMGYERSPVNIYYCYDIEGSDTDSGSGRTLKKCMVEAYNTPWGESVTFVFNPSSDLLPKAEYISPFMDMDSNWRFKVSEPGDNLYAIFTVQHPKFGNYFSGSLTANRVTIKSFMPEVDYEAFFWLMPHKVSIAAYWNALIGFGGKMFLFMNIQEKKIQHIGMKPLHGMTRFNVVRSFQTSCRRCRKREDQASIETSSGKILSGPGLGATDHANSLTNTF